MPEHFDEIRHHSLRMVARYGARDRMIQEIRRAFLMQWTQQPRGDWIKATMSPSAYDTALGAIRLLTAAEPQLSVPYDETDTNARSVSELVETAAKAMWSRAGRVALRPVHYEVVFSAVLFGEVNGAVTKTADMLKHAKRAKLRRGVKRLEHIAHETPYLFTVYNPEQCYPDHDHLGLRGLLRRSNVTWGEVTDTWGELAENAYPGEHQDDDVLVLNDWFDWDYRCVWLESVLSAYGSQNTAGQTPGVSAGTSLSDEPLLLEEHELPFLPVVSQIGEGTAMFDLPEEQRLPFLYGYIKSGLWNRENLALTVIYSLLFTLGSSSLLLRKTNTPGSPLTIDRSIPGGMVDIMPDESIGPLVEKTLDPGLVQGLELARTLGAEATISKIALGGQPQHALAFSSISLLAQSGRLPLVAPKEIGGQVVSNMLTIALRWMKNDSKKERIYSREGKYIELDPDDIPEDIVINCNLEPDLPNDKLQQANIANLLVNGPNQLSSKRWARENILQIGQSMNMDREIYMEQRLRFEIERALKALTAQDDLQLQQMAAALQQQMMQAQQEQAMPPQGGPPEGMPPQVVGEGGAPTEEEAAFAQMMDMMQAQGGAYPPEGQVGPGAPLTGPLPPRAMQGR